MDDRQQFFVPRKLTHIVIPTWLWASRLFSPCEKMILCEIEMQSQGVTGFKQSDEWLSGLLGCDLELVAYFLERLARMNFIRVETDSKGDRVIYLVPGNLNNLRSHVAHYKEQLVQSEAKKLPKGQLAMREIAQQAADDALERDLKTHEDHINEARHALWHKMPDRERRIVEAMKQSQERGKKK